MLRNSAANCAEVCPEFVPAGFYKSWRITNCSRLRDVFHKNATYLDPFTDTIITGRTDILKHIQRVVKRFASIDWDLLEEHSIGKGAVHKCEISFVMHKTSVKKTALILFTMKDKRIIRCEMFYDGQDLSKERASSIKVFSVCSHHLYS